MVSDQNLEEQMGFGGGDGGTDHHHSQGNSSRWNPTKDQISMLENIYMQGIRTPTADQIQQITARLKAYGDIQGKNVFYWFQNHKARQRQKQKQENIAYINQHFVHNHQQQPGFPSPASNAVFGSFYIPQSNIGFYPQYTKVLLPTNCSFKRRPRTGKINQERARNYIKINQANGVNSSKTHQETLPLFPLNPTGILHGNNINNSPDQCVIKPSSTSSATPSSCSSDETANTTGVEDYYCNDKPFFDFFSREQ